MSQTIIVSNKTYERLRIIKRHLGPRMSFDSVITEFLNTYCSNQRMTKAWIDRVYTEMQRIEIYKFIREIQDRDLVNPMISESDIMAVILLLINKQWDKLNEILRARLDLVDFILEKDKIMDKVISSESEKPIISQTLESAEDMNVKSAINTIGGEVESEKSTVSSRGIKRKSKKN